jgi:hypothetical protein
MVAVPDLFLGNTSATFCPLQVGSPCSAAVVWDHRSVGRSLLSPWWTASARVRVAVQKATVLAPLFAVRAESSASLLRPRTRPRQRCSQPQHRSKALAASSASGLPSLMPSRQEKQQAGIVLSHRVETVCDDRNPRARFPILPVASNGLLRRVYSRGSENISRAPVPR